MVETAKQTRAFSAEVRLVIERDGGTKASFEGLSSWYSVPAHLEPIIRHAAASRQPVLITTSTNAVMTAELELPAGDHRPH